MDIVSNSQTTTSETICNDGECVRITSTCTDGNCVESRLVVDGPEIVNDGNTDVVSIEADTDVVADSDDIDDSDVSDESDESGCDLRDYGFAIIFNGADMTLIFGIMGLIVLIVFMIAMFQKKKINLNKYKEKG